MTFKEQIGGFSVLPFRIFSHGISEVRLRRKHGIICFLPALMMALLISTLKSDIKPKLSLKNLLVLFILEVCTFDIQPRPAVSKQAARQPALDHWQTLNPDLLEGERWSPKVRYPKTSPLRVLALPWFSSFIAEVVWQVWVWVQVYFKCFFIIF